jgi:hypothetical protein
MPVPTEVERDLGVLLKKGQEFFGVIQVEILPLGFALFFPEVNQQVMPHHNGELIPVGRKDVL